MTRAAIVALTKHMRRSRRSRAWYRREFFAALELAGMLIVVIVVAAVVFIGIPIFVAVVAR